MNFHFLLNIFLLPSKLQQHCLAMRYYRLCWALQWPLWPLYPFSDIDITNWRPKSILWHGKFPGMMCFYAM